jgi:hypothetical protein
VCLEKRLSPGKAQAVSYDPFPGRVICKMMKVVYPRKGAVLHYAERKGKKGVSSSLLTI